MKKKINVLLLLFVLFSSTAFGQKGNEIGIFAGVSYYTGDVNPDKLFKSVSPAISILYKSEINKRYQTRISLSYANLTGSDSKSNHIYQQNRNHNFSTTITELNFLVEFNFLPYKSESRFDFISPYIVAGIGAFISPTATDLPVNPVIPLGIGLKYAFTKKLSVSAELLYRKTFTDALDNLQLDEYNGSATFESKQRNYNANKDWYSFAGLILTYKFSFNNSSCPAYANF